MTPLVTIVGPADRRLEELVRSCGVKTSVTAGLDLLTGAEMPAEEPSILIVDVRGAARLPSTLAAARVRHPRAAVVLLSTTLDPVLMLEAMRAGVSECVPEPITSSALSEALTRVLAQHGGHSGDVFAFVGAKGGVGTTTLAVNVATALAASGPTLLIDFNPCFGDAGVLLSAEPRFSTFDALENTHRLDQAFFEGLAVHTAAGPWLLPSPAQPTSHVLEAGRVRLLLEFAARHYRYTVLDVPRTCRPALESLAGAAATIVVTTQELASVKAASTLADMLRRRYGREKTSVVVTRYDRAAEIDKDDVEMAVHGEVRCLIPNDYRAALEALNVGQPLAAGRSSKLAAAIQDLATTLARTSAPVEPAAPAVAGGLLGRIAHLCVSLTT